MTKPKSIGEQLDRVQAAAAKRKAETAARPEDGQHVNRTDADIARAREAATTAASRAIEGSWAAQVPSKYRNASTGDFEAPIASGLERWQGAWLDGVNLVLSGPVGTGKTRAAFAAVRGPYQTGTPFAFWPELEFRQALDWNNHDHQAVMAAAMEVPLLVLDDLGAASPNDWWTSQIDMLVNRRWLNDLATVITTNFDRQVLLEVLGERTISRIAESAIALRLSGADRRRT